MYFRVFLYLKVPHIIKKMCIKSFFSGYYWYVGYTIICMWHLIQQTLLISAYPITGKLYPEIKCTSWGLLTFSQYCILSQNCKY